jgi:hypothetical protein
MGRPEPVHSTGTQETVCKYEVQSPKVWAADQPETPRPGAFVCGVFILKVPDQAPCHASLCISLRADKGPEEGR